MATGKEEEFNMKKVIDIYAPLRNYTGYAEVVRNLVWRLYVRGWKINFEEFKGWSSVAMKLSPELEQFYSMLESNQYPSTKRLNICLPEQCKLEEEKLNINLTMFEAKRQLPKLWIESSNRIDYIIVPTKQNYRMWDENMGMLHKKMSLLPFGVDLDALKNATKLPIVCVEGIGKSSTTINVCEEYKNQLLVLQEFISRKNLRNALKAFYVGCQKDPDRIKDTCLVLKLNSNSGSKLVEFNKMCDEVKAEVSELYGDVSKNLFVYTRMINDNNMYSFFNSFSHYFSMSCGEGWDLNCIKAAALGKTVIVPKSSSYIDYLNDDRAYLIPCNEEKIEISEANLVRIYKESMWDVPDVEAASDIVANLGPKKDCSEFIKKNYNWNVCVDKLSKILESVDFNIKHTKSDMSYVAKDLTMSLCKTIGQKCGIGEYAKTMHKVFRDKKAPFVTVGCDVFTLMTKIEQFRPNIVHIQNEYQFYPPKRLGYMLDTLKSKRIKTVLTQHTYNDNAYILNKIFAKQFDQIVVHNARMVIEYKECFGRDVIYVPMPAERLTIPEVEVEDDGVLRIGFFGFCYSHKGLDRLINIMRNVLTQVPVLKQKRIKLVVYSSKPKQDHLNYYEQCKSLINIYGMGNLVEWNDQYLEYNDLISKLRKLDIVCLPYDDYGSIGASAALVTCAQAEKPVVICSTDSPFFDVRNDYNPNIYSVPNADLEKVIADQVHQYLDTGDVPTTSVDVWDRYFYDRNWDKFADTLTEIYNRLKY